MNKQIEWLLSMILKECVEGFYGSMTINIQNGKILNLETKRSEKPPQ